MDVLEIIKTAVTGASVVLTVCMIILYIISKHSKKVETKQKARDALETTQSIFDLFNIVQNAVIMADQNTNFSAKEKFNSAFMSVKNELFKQNKNVDDVILTDMIENNIVLSNKVNSDVNHKQKQTELKKIEIIKE